MLSRCAAAPGLSLRKSWWSWMSSSGLCSSRDKRGGKDMVTFLWREEGVDEGRQDCTFTKIRNRDIEGDILQGVLKVSIYIYLNTYKIHNIVFKSSIQIHCLKCI